MQMIQGKCAACGGDGRRERVGWIQSQAVIPPERCTRCQGSGLEPECPARRLPENPFCIVHVGNAETAAYLRGLLSTPDKYLAFNQENDFKRSFPGGLGVARELVGSVRISTSAVWTQLDSALTAAGITKTSAPWL